MITKIIIKNIASYNSNGVEIEELTKLNYFLEIMVVENQQ